MDMTKVARIRELNQALKGAGYLSVSWRLVSYPLSQATAEWSGEVRAWGGRDIPQIEIIIEANDIDVVLGGLVAALEARVKELALGARDVSCPDCTDAKFCKRHWWKGFFR